MLVPWKKAQVSAPTVSSERSKVEERTLTPGAVMSGLMRWLNGLGPRDEKPAMMSAFVVTNSAFTVPFTVVVPDGLIAAPALFASMTAGIVGNGSVPSCPMAAG